MLQQLDDGSSFPPRGAVIMSVTSILIDSEQGESLHQKDLLINLELCMLLDHAMNEFMFSSCIILMHLFIKIIIHLFVF